MRHIVFGSDASTASVAILVKEVALNSDRIKQEYINELGANPEGFIAYSLWYNTDNKCPADIARDYLKDVLHSIKTLNIKQILITDSFYFKYLTKETKPATSFIGYSVPSRIEGYEDEFEVFYSPNYQAAKYNPKTKQDIITSLHYFKKFLTGNYSVPGQDIIHSEQYPKTLAEIQDKLNWLLTKPALTVDIETKGLKFWNCGISTISFAWDKHNFTSIPVERGDFLQDVTEVFRIDFPDYVKALLKNFFKNYSGKLIGHNTNFDFKVLTYELWMENLADYRGMIDGIQCLTRHFDDTKLIAYLATNNAVENVLRLKSLSAEYMGNYAESDITDTTKIPLDQLLQYNGKDCLATWYVYEKYQPIMAIDQQSQIYEEVFKPSVITLLQTELVGMPIIMKEVHTADKILTDLSNKYNDSLQNSILIKEFQLDVKSRKCSEFTAAAKQKVFTMDDPRIARLTFNPNSNQQVAELLYDYCNLPILDLTDSKQPSVSTKTLTKLLNHTTNVTYINIIQTLIDLSQVNKILSSFIPAFKNNSIALPDGSYRLYGNFNLGGTVSGRLSSSDPNLQNLPSHSKWGKLIKKCFGCGSGWLFGGADFNSLEDMISALTTRDPNKMKVYIEGYDGHCLRAFYYFNSEMNGIVETVPSINSIKDIYPDLRQKSKAPTFALTYQGTHITLMNNLGLPRDEALEIEKNYHKLYQHSDEWVASKLQQATINGYVTGAFGLRLRTPLLKMNGPGKLHYKAAAEGRTAGNMLGQSYGMLNSRAANEFRERVWKSKYKYDVFLCGQIHDAIYIIWKNTLGVTKWVNDNIIACMRWNGLVELQHPVVKVGAELDIFYPNWSIATTLKNEMSLADILTLCRAKPKGK